MITLGINLLDFKPNYLGGINSFSLGLIKPLGKKCKLRIYTNSKSYLFLKKKFPNANIIIHSKNNLIFNFFQLISVLTESKRLFKYNHNLYYRELKEKIDKECDILYCSLSYLKPLNLNIPTVTSIHDLQHHHLPENFNFIQLKYRAMMYKLTIENSSKIQASSKFIKEDIKKIYPQIKKSKIIVIREGTSKDFKFKNFNFKNDFIFFPGQLWPHKNHMVVLNALKQLYIKHNLNLKLILVGEKFIAFKKINNFINQNKKLNIKYLGKVHFDKLLLLYKNCRFLISPAIYESSSIPILEACITGRPIIASNTRSNLEMAKTIKINFFKTNDHKNLSKLLLKIWFNKKLINDDIKRNKKIVKHLSWEKKSIEYYKIFSSLIKK